MMSPEEMEMRISLHSTQREMEVFTEHPPTLGVPHYTYEPAIAWGRPIVYLRPGNHA